jgi:site-specific DNA recombinase
LLVLALGRVAPARQSGEAAPEGERAVSLSPKGAPRRRAAQGNVERRKSYPRGGHGGVPSRHNEACPDQASDLPDAGSKLLPFGLVDERFIRLLDRRGGAGMGGEELAGLTIAIYARFSSENQSEASIEDQVRRCSEYVEARGGSVRPELVFADRAVSGASAERPQFVQLVERVTATPRRIDAVVAWDLERVGRDAADLHLLHRTLEFARIRLIGVSDGIDTFAEHSAITFGMKAIIASTYLRTLRKNTLRGLEGRALAGFATGGVALGYCLRREFGPDGKPIGSRIEIDAERAGVIRHIFALYLEGVSLAGIAKKLNAESVAPPRVHQKGRRVGWKDTTIRAVLHNETYVGRWRYKAREWRKLPGTNKRRYAKRDDANVIVQERPHLRIIDQDLWEGVQRRLRAVSAHYTRTAEGGPKGRSVPGRATPYLFSSLLYCGGCGGKMIVSGGTSASYYRCEGHTRRGVCKNDLSVREEVVRSSLLDELRHRLASEQGILHARKRLVERLGEIARDQGGELRERRTRLDKVERDIEKLIDFVTEGHGTRAVSDRLKVLAGR